jgi:hypothetical protein
MQTILSCEDTKLFEMYLDIIIDDTQNLSSGNIAHRAASIKNHAKAIRRMINKSKMVSIT